MTKNTIYNEEIIKKRFIKVNRNYRCIHLNKGYIKLNTSELINNH